MKRLTSLAVALVTAGSLAGCSLTEPNPNAPDAQRAFVDPAGLAQLLGGAFRTWVETRTDFYSAMVMTAQADSYTASWNNAALRFYTSVGVECPVRCGWTNSSVAPEAAGGFATPGGWYGYYTVLSSATDVLRAIKNGLCFDSNCSTDNTLTSRNTAIAKMLQGMALSGIAQMYDQGFVVDENTDISQISTQEFAPRAEVRDAAIAKFEEAYVEAGKKTWSTPSEWMGVGAGISYNNEQIRRVIRTMQAELLAMYPRNVAENTAVNWGQVATYASQGISSGTPFDWNFYIDITGREGLDAVKTWGNSIGTMRVDNRVANLLVPSHQNPWPAPNGNPCPYAPSADKRVGDGSWGPEDDFNGYGTVAATANAGTDFACASVVIFPAARGSYHQSNFQHIRYQYLAYRGENLPGFDATGQDPLYTRQMNDLLWAEGLIRSNSNLSLASDKVNNSRVGRGGLAAVAASQSALLTALAYEQEIEFMGQGATPFYNRRRVDGLLQGTPRHMPVPAKEMDVLLREIYTFGGPGEPDMSAGADASAGRGVRSVRQIWAESRELVKRATGRKQ